MTALWLLPLLFGGAVLTLVACRAVSREEKEGPGGSGDVGERDCRIPEVVRNSGGGCAVNPNSTWPQVLILLTTAVNLVMDYVNDGKPHKRNISFTVTLINNSISLFVLWAGGFF